ncbi:MAG: 4-hydroxy-3-methylbut-2-enyl diphosphate reductase [Thiotrichales bacterium]|nr:4-hydroxy-3-methylbut-2-enyl diphosphate reductase [Thiotrichales bacterium]MBT4653227.1 4-hydroxy-3-methylbut-2-enyl diphosphate reductase [Thiotrichales bacterium]MBT5499519.1 4-hydroxy-3-methylbut-2-enyl diphosphate reductase [Thiotrichales bacterium]MBT5983831.1 4-hydroxy-3-methylbut-2-enyl diphosphate reductase [Thiotrichales bacterium]MBT7150610.1 4-hydroxy-3-methylbut-2-enyl diphosphate reductase [Thiotrichales bacterium]
MKIYLANPRGFCAGVDRAIEIVERSIIKHGPPIYVRHEVVHNKFVVNNLKNKGAIFVNEISEVPSGSVVIYSAHGVSQAVRKEANDISAVIYDATCPLVTKVHKEVTRRQKNNHQVILIGHAGHPEVEGTLGQATENNNIDLVESIRDVEKIELQQGRDISFTTQTTLSIDDTNEIVEALKVKFPNIQSPKKSDICYATQNRQDSVKEVIKNSEVLIVIGSKNSSNSNRLREIADNQGKPSYLVDGVEDIDNEWLNGITSIGLTAGASAPEILVQEVVSFLMSSGGTEVIEVDGAEESVSFPIPALLKE